MPYSQVKVYSDGSHYIGIPYEPNPRAKNRRPRYEEVIEVKEPSEETTVAEDDVAVLEQVEQNLDNVQEKSAGTPIYDIKPYLPQVDAHPGAAAGFSGPAAAHALALRDPGRCLDALDPQTREALCGVLENDPRPGYQQDPGRVYGLSFAGWAVRFRVEGDTLTLLSVRWDG